MDSYDTMMPRLLPTEASKPRLYQPLLVTAGIIVTCYGLLTAVSSLLPILGERIEANRAGNVTAFRDQITVHPKPKTVITVRPQPTLVLPTAAVPTVETVPQSDTVSGTRQQAAPVSGPTAGEPIPPKEAVPQGSNTLSSMRRPAVPVSPGPIVVEPIRPKLHPEVVVPPGWYIFVPPGDAQHKSPNPRASFARWTQGEGFGSARECERYRQQVVDDTAYERDHNEELSDPYDYKIELFSHAECVSVQEPRLTQRR